MKKKSYQPLILALSLLGLASTSFAIEAINTAQQNETAAPTVNPSSMACPLNSGGPSLLGSSWRLKSIYGNDVPPELQLTLNVGKHAMMGLSGCNQYQAYFAQVGHRGFKVIKINQTRKACPVLPTVVGGPTINVGNWEGNYLRVLGRAGSVAQKGNQMLEFYDVNGKASLILTKQTQLLSE